MSEALALGLLFAPERKTKVVKKNPRFYSKSEIATAGNNTLKFALPKSGKITKVDIHAQATTEYFKLVDCYVESPRGGSAVRLVNGHLLPSVDASLYEILSLKIQDQSQVTAIFYDMTAGVRLWVQVAIEEDD